VTSISKQSATQRAGRAGREAPGKCFRIFTEKTYQELNEVTVPEILRCNLSSVILSLKALGITNISAVDFIDQPEQRSLLAAFQTLIKLGAVCPTSADLTPIGN
jgi:HrpA-like RNA helicase